MKITRYFVTILVLTLLLTGIQVLSPDTLAVADQRGFFITKYCRGVL